MYPISGRWIPVCSMELRMGTPGLVDGGTDSAMEALE